MIALRPCDFQPSTLQLSTYVYFDFEAIQAYRDFPQPSFFVRRPWRSHSRTSATQYGSIDLTLVRLDVFPIQEDRRHITTRGYGHFRTVVLMNLGNSTSTGTSLSFDRSIGMASGKKRGNSGNCCFRERMHV